MEEPPPPSSLEPLHPLSKSGALLSKHTSVPQFLSLSPRIVFSTPGLNTKLAVTLTRAPPYYTTALLAPQVSRGDCRDSEVGGRTCLWDGKGCPVTGGNLRAHRTQGDRGVSTAWAQHVGENVMGTFRLDATFCDPETLGMSGRKKRATERGTGHSKSDPGHYHRQA